MSRLKSIRRSMGGETTLEGVIGAMGKEREEQVLERIAKFTNETVVVIKKLLDVVERFATDQYEELEASAQELDALESAADDTKEQILDRLSLGGIFPMNRADLSRLVTSMDSINNLSAGAADRIVMRRLAWAPARPDPVDSVAETETSLRGGTRLTTRRVRLAGRTLVSRTRRDPDETFQPIV